VKPISFGPRMYSRDPAHTLCRSAVVDACACEDQRTEESNATLQTEATTTAKARAVKTDRLTAMTPSAAPANIASIEASRRCQRGLLPRAREESAARPVMVNVNTVVVTSETPSFRTATFLMPMATAARP
jgi:hypothetical protein